MKIVASVLGVFTILLSQAQPLIILIYYKFDLKWTEINKL